MIQWLKVYWLKRKLALTTLTQLRTRIEEVGATNLTLSEMMLYYNMLSELYKITTAESQIAAFQEEANTEPEEPTKEGQYL